MNHEIHCAMRYDAKSMTYTAHTQYSHKPDGFNHVKYNCCQFPMYPANVFDSSKLGDDFNNIMAVLWDDRELNESIAAGDWKIVKLYPKQDKQLTGYNTHWDYDDNDDAYESERERKLAKWKNEDLEPDYYSSYYDSDLWDEYKFDDEDDARYEQQMDDVDTLAVWTEHEADAWYAQDDWEKGDKDDIWDEQAYWDKQAYWHEQEEANRSSDPDYDLEDQLIVACARKRVNRISYEDMINGWNKKFKNSKAKYGKSTCKGNHRKYRKPDDAVWYELMEGK